MSVTVRATSVITPFTTNIVIPAETQVGDLILMQSAKYQNYPAMPSGTWNLISQRSGSSSYTNYQNLHWKLAVAGDAGSTVTFADNSDLYYYGAVIILVIAGPYSSSPINITGQTGGGASFLGLASLTTTAPTRRFYFASMMQDGGTVPTFTPPSGISSVVSRVGQNNTYFRATAYSADPTLEGAGTYSPSSISANGLSGGWATHSVAVLAPNSAPTATNLSPNTFRDNRVATNFTWTYNDTEGNAQNAYQIQYRLKGSTGAWTTVTGTTGTSHTFAANTFSLGEEYEWQVRVSDSVVGYGAWSTLTYFVAGTSSWTEGSEVTTSTQSGSISGLAPGSYYVQVRTADAEGFGPWSASDTVTVAPPTNIKVKVGGSFVDGINMVKVGGVWKQAPPTKYKSGGAFN